MGIYKKEHLCHPHVPSVFDRAGQVPGQPVRVNS
jgi:hypothetical protein